MNLPNQNSREYELDIYVEFLTKILEFKEKSRRDTRHANIIPVPHDMMFENQ